MLSKEQLKDMYNDLQKVNINLSNKRYELTCKIVDTHNSIDTMKQVDNNANVYALMEEYNKLCDNEREIETTHKLIVEAQIVLDRLIKLYI